jgi:hypothetical protein
MIVEFSLRHVIKYVTLIYKREFDGYNEFQA